MVVGMWCNIIEGIYRYIWRIAYGWEGRCCHHLPTSKRWLFAKNDVINYNHYHSEMTTTTMQMPIITAAQVFIMSHRILRQLGSRQLLLQELQQRAQGQQVPGDQE